MGNIKKITPIGNFQTYDLEVDHPDHQFYTSNGILSSNSHAVLYSMIGYRTAYLKAHYPIEFLLANLMAEVNSNTQDAPVNIETIKQELRKNRIKILPPNINTSQLTYTITDGNKLLTGLDALKFVGEDAIKDIIEKRPFKSFLDFMARVDTKKVRANNIQALAAAGAMDIFKIPRRLIFLYVSDFRKKLQVWKKKHDPSKEEFVYPWPKEPDWKMSEMYAMEQFYLAEAFVCRPPQAYGTFFEGDHKTIYDVKKAQDKTKMPCLKGIVRNFFEFKVKKETSKYYGQPMIKALIEDKNGQQCMCTIFPDRWKMVQERIKEVNSKAKFEPGVAISFSGSTNNYEDEIGLILDQLFDIAPPPATPPDLKPKKLNFKEIKAKLSEEMKKTGEIKDLFEAFEDDLYDQGLIDLDEDFPENG